MLLDRTLCASQAEERDLMKRMKQSAIAVLFGLGLLLIVAQPSAAADENVHSGSTAVTASIPQDLNYLFDLPWCSRWGFTCMSCEQTTSGIKCVNRKDACHETFKFYHCEAYNLPKGCVAWVDGCNFCGRNGCTLMACQEYFSPNKPSFACTRYESNEKGVGAPTNNGRN